MLILQFLFFNFYNHILEGDDDFFASGSNYCQMIKVLMKRFLILITLSVLLGTRLPTVHAELISVPVDCVCVNKNYQVYGDEQPSTVNDEECAVLVELDQPSLEEPEGEGSLGLGEVSGLSALTSPLAVLFQQSAMKDSFLQLLYSVFKGHTEKYHAFLDEEVFGAAIAKISSFETSEALEAYLSEQEGECSEMGKNSSPKPECVIERAMCSYEKYIGVLFHETGQAVATQGIVSDDIDAVLFALQNRDQAIVDEAEHAQEALDTAIAVYSQFYQTYRLHLRFKELIVYLSQVRALTGSLRELVGCIPNKFVGVATTKCN